MNDLSPFQILANKGESECVKFMQGLSTTERETLKYTWRNFLARPSQLMPLDPSYSAFAMVCGRGAGKTRSGAEWVREKVEAGYGFSDSQILIVSATAADNRDTIVKGSAGLMSVFPPHQRPVYEPSNRRINFHTGAYALFFAGSDPDTVRSQNASVAWLDESAKHQYPTETMNNVMLALRQRDPQILLTTTPKNIHVVREILGNGYGKTYVSRSSTFANAANLSPKFLKTITKQYKGTRLWKQEVLGELLEGLGGALWTDKELNIYRVPHGTELPKMRRVVIGVDPAVSSEENSDKTGIVAVGVDENNIGYVLEDGSMKATPEVWARQAVTLFDKHSAHLVVAETNQGGEMVESVLKTVRPSLPVKTVKATKAKHTRAEPVSSLFAQGRVKMVGYFPEIEEQLCNFSVDGYAGAGSPDGADALVWACTELFTDIVTPVKIAQKSKRRYQPPALP